MTEQSQEALAVQNAQAAVDAANETSKAATAAAKEAAANHKQAVAYEKSLGAEDENKATAQETVNGWAAEVERTKAAKADAAENLKAAKAALKDAKSALKAAEGPKDGAARRKFDDEAVLVRTEKELPRGVMGAVAGVFDGTVKYAAAVEAATTAVAALHAEKPITSVQWLNSPKAYVEGYVAGAVRQGLLTAAEAA